MPVTINGTTGITSPGGDTSTSLTTSGLTIGTTSIGAGDSTRFKNRIINGDMRIDQRNAGASVTLSSGTSAYLTDRFLFQYSQTSKLSAQQSTTSTTGFVNSLLATSLAATSVAAGDYFQVSQRIEGLNMADLAWGTANAKTVTLSFWVRSSLTGTFGGALKNSAQNRSYPFTYTINSANTWELETITIVGDTTGTWLTTNGTGMEVVFGLGMGSTYSGTAGAWAGANYGSATGATSVVGTNGATFYITGVQLEVGTSATGFEYVDYTTQLAMCQRYFQTYSPPPIRGLVASSGSPGRMGMPLPVVMRTSATVTIISALPLFDGGGVVTTSGIVTNFTTPTTLEIDLTGSLTAFRPCVCYAGAGGQATLSAEL